MSPKTIVTLGIVAVLVLIGGLVLSKAVGVCDAQEWIFVQPYWGEARIQTDSGMYWKGMASTWNYPRYLEFVYSDEEDEGEKAKEAIHVTFNDGSTASISTFIRIQLPSISDDQKSFHQKFGGDMKSIKASTLAHLTECLKSTAPLMSSTEHQVSRKAEFSQTVERQLSVGLYEMKQTRKVLEGRKGEDGESVTVMATEIMTDSDGQRLIAKKSPLTDDYKIKITQFSVKGTKYDPETLQQFAAKKQQFLAAEQSKAEREAMVQEELKIIAEGKKDVAQAEADGNVLKETAVIAAQQKAEVALQAKIEAETKAEQLLSVAQIEKEEAQIQLDMAVIDAQAVIELAKAKAEEIKITGAITELEQAEIDARVQIMEAFAKNLPLMQVPSTVIGGSYGGNGNGSNGMTDAMMPLIMLKMLGIENLADMGKVRTTNSQDRRIIQSNRPVSQVPITTAPVVAQK